MNLYLTADYIGKTNHGGGSVTYHESKAFRFIAGHKESTIIWDRDTADKTVYKNDKNEPWRIDDYFHHWLEPTTSTPKITHVYAGTFPQCIPYIKSKGGKVTYTAAAHDIEVSQQEHLKLGLSYNYPHLTEPEQLKRYLIGYLAADVLICPSNHSVKVMQKFGASNQIEIIPHGTDIPNESSIKPFPKRFTVGYLGAFGPDKGVRYLLEAWKKLGWDDAVLVLGGKDSNSPFALNLIKIFGEGNIEVRGFIPDVSDFYNSLSAYVQPSCSEGFGLEVLEAMSYKRPVICSEGAGACDLVSAQFRCISGNVDSLVSQLRTVRDKTEQQRIDIGESNHKESKNYSWDVIEQKYARLWRNL